MSRFFATEGPIKPHRHYNVDPLTRLDWEDVQMLIEQDKYFVLHAPRQTGKTSTLLAMMHELNLSGQYQALYVNIEAAQAMRGDVDRGMKVVCGEIANQAAEQDITTHLKTLFNEQLSSDNWGSALRAMLAGWAKACDKPCVLFLDEVDALIGDTLISLLRQIRAGYSQRPAAFPQSVVLCGVRDVKDYCIHSGGEIITGGSAFNIKAESLKMGTFIESEMQSLFQQHTVETGQGFEDTIFPQLWQDTQGQPWLVNALGYEMAWKAKENRERSKEITLEDYRAARERLIQSQATHLDQLSDKLKESRVRSIIAPMLEGEDPQQMKPDDVDYAVDVGLITRQRNGAITIANRIYQEVIPRELSWGSQMGIEQSQAGYINTDNSLNIPKLIRNFQQFFRENADAWLERFDYKEAGPQLIMQAFLQRIINGGGRINREYALGRKRTDLIIEWPTTDQGFYGHVQRIVIELKILRGSLDRCIEKGLEQTADYADKLGASEAHLVIFNRDAKLSWDDKIYQRDGQYQQRTIGVWGC
ncbi:MAG: AAA-like domain-containing protein [Psychrosphaera sp.]|nr:AAA-like domain-containing protein [Psychrosphaera sp.]